MAWKSKQSVNLYKKKKQKFLLQIFQNTYSIAIIAFKGKLLNFAVYYDLLAVAWVKVKTF